MICVGDRVSWGHHVCNGKPRCERGTVASIEDGVATVWVDRGGQEECLVSELKKTRD